MKRSEGDSLPRFHTNSWGQLSDEQAEALEPIIRDKVIADLGAGYLELSHVLLELGAARVVAIDTCLSCVMSSRMDSIIKAADDRIEVRSESFSRVHSLDVDIAFLSWPTTYETHVDRLLATIPRVIYLGKNTDGTACGTAGLWLELFLRPVELYHPHPTNTLAVYGERGVMRTRDDWTGEEVAAWGAVSGPPYKVYSYNELEVGPPP